MLREEETFPAYRSWSVDFNIKQCSPYFGNVTAYPMICVVCSKKYKPIITIVHTGAMGSTKKVALVTGATGIQVGSGTLSVNMSASSPAPPFDLDLDVSCIEEDATAVESERSGHLWVQGRALISHLSKPDSGWDEIYGVSRKPLDFENRAKRLSFDMYDKAVCAYQCPMSSTNEI